MHLHPVRFAAIAQRNADRRRPFVLSGNEADLADRVPRRMPRVEPRRHGPAVRPDLVGERGVDVRPPGDDPLAVHVLGALHGRHRARQPVALVRWAVDLHALAALLEIGRRAEPGHERVAHLAQERKIRGQWSVELGGAEIEQRVAGTAVEGASEAGARGGGEAVARGAWSGRGIEQQRAGGKNGDAHASCDARRKRDPRSIPDPRCAGRHCSGHRPSGLLLTLAAQRDVTAYQERR